MAALAGILNHSSSGRPLPAPVAMDTSSGNSDDSSSSNSATISANDFLTLLVTEMQNQDPTADTDPNEYINQLVNVNSLEQLIDINQTLSTATGTSGTSPTGGVIHGGASAQSVSARASHSFMSVADGSAGPAEGAATPWGLESHSSVIQGNLGIPSATSASHRVAESLNGRHPAR